MSKTKLSLILIIIGTITFALGMGIYAMSEKLSSFEYFVAGLVIAVVIFSIIIGRKKLRDEKKGLPADDELSKRIKEKAAAKAFYISFYLWVFVIIFAPIVKVDHEISIGFGLMGMALLFMIFWIDYSKKGLGNEDQN